MTSSPSPTSDAHFWSAHEQLGLLPLDLRMAHLMQRVLSCSGAARVELFLSVPATREVLCARLGLDGALETSLRGDRLKGALPRVQAPAQRRPQPLRDGQEHLIWAVVGGQDDDARALMVLARDLPDAASDEALATIEGLLPGMQQLRRRLLWSHGLLPGQAALAARERATLNLMLGGLSEREISEALGVTAASAHQYVLRVNRKLGVSSRAQLLHAWMTDGLPDDPPRHERPTSADARAAELERFWRTLSQRAPYPVRDYLRHVFRALCALFDAANVSLVPSYHREDLPADDPLGGWRGHIYLPFIASAEDLAYAEEIRTTEVYVEEPRAQLMTSGAGQPRVYLSSELAAHIGLNAARLRELQELFEIGDRALGVLPVSARNELYFCHDRLFGDPPFDAHDKALMLELLPHMRAFALRLTLYHGLLPGQRALTPKERETLEHLLGGLNEREVAEALGVAQSAAHQYIQDVHAKLGCTSKNTLLRWWLNPVASLGDMTRPPR